MSSTLNWIATILLIIGFALILSAVVYSESIKAIDNTFRIILGFGVVLLLLGVLLVIVGHWNIFFPMETTKI